MTKEEFILLTKKSVLLDGATGSNLMAAGMPRGICTEQWILEHPEMILHLQNAYVEAGSQIIYAPTFGGNRRNLASHGLEKNIADINFRLVALSQQASRGHTLIAGDITTLGMLSPAGPLSYEEAFEIYREQISYLKEAGVDLLVAETMIQLDETLAALDAAHDVCDLPVLCSMSVEADGSIFTGGNAIEACAALESAGADAVGLNCSVGPDQLVSVVRNICETVSVPVLAKPNAGMPLIDENGNAVYSMTAPEFGQHMAALRDAGATLLGGCCGTTPDFIAEIKKALA